MNLTRVLQPYVCCLGNPVAGNPTQFVMYRAARACGVDWRFFTSQVELDQFDVAFRGVQALGLRGMALFEPFQARAIDLLDSVTESAMCLGGVNVARLDGNSWLGDNTLGIAIANCVEISLEEPNLPSSVDEVDREPASAILIVGERKLAKAMRLSCPHLAQRILFAPASESPQSDSLALHEQWELSSLDELLQRGLKVGCLISTSFPTAGSLRQMTALPWSSSPSSLVLGNCSDKQARLWKETLKVHGVAMIESVELMAHQAAVDFYFWTGVTPAIDLIRDSLEEYLQW